VDEKLTARAKLIYERDNNSPLFLRIADSYLQNSNPENAISILEEGLKNFPDHPLAFILMGKANVMVNEIEMAEYYFKKSSELLNTNQTYTYYKKEYNLPDKQSSPFDSSRGSVFINSSADDILKIEDLILKKSQPVEERLEQIANELMNKRLEQTDNFPLRESDQQQYSPDKSKLATETLANIYLSQGQKNEAIKIYESLVNRNPGKKEYYLEKIREIRSQ
jgi:tetratricopeptide (TPR) repeat protein